MNQLSLFKTRRFLPLFVTQFFGAFNDNVFKNAFVILVTYRLAEIAGLNAQILVTFAAGVFIFPFFLFSAIAGQLADKFEKSRLISIIKFIEINLMLIAIVGFYQQSIWILMLVLFALGAHSTFFGPLKYAILPDHLHEKELIAGNGLIEAGTFLAILLGTILGGLLILSARGELLISIALVLVALSGWFSSWFIPKTTNYNSALQLRYNVFKETFRLLQYSKQRRDIFLSILGISWFWLVGATFLAEFPVFAKDDLGTDQSVVTFFFTLFSVGLAIGSLFCNRLLKGRVSAAYVPLAALGITLFTVDLYIAASQVVITHSSVLINLKQFLQTFNGWRITIDLLLMAICGGLYTVPLYAILQQRSDEKHRARVIASNNVMNALFMVMAALVTMLMLHEGFSVNAVFLTIAIANSVVVIYLCKLLPGSILKVFFRRILKFIYRVEVNDLDNYYHAGERVLIIANHTSFLDAVLLAAFLPDKLVFAVNTLVSKKWWMRIFLNLVEAYPIDPINPMALKSLIEFVRQDRRCVIFPEGRLTMTGALMKIYEGPGLVADKSGAKLLPIRIQGAQYTPFSRLKGKVRIQWAPKITITILPPREINVPSDIKGRKRRQKIGYQLYDIMVQMMFESSNYHQTLFATLIDAKTAHGRGYAVIEDTKRVPMSYQKFITRCFILGDVIAKDTNPKDYVGILLPNVISTAVTFFALHAYCRIPVMLNYSTGIHNVEQACQIAKIKKIYTSREFIRVAKLQEMANFLSQSGITVFYLEDLPQFINFWRKLKGFMLAQLPRLAYRLLNRKHSKYLLNADEPAVVLFTSGTEGTPKGVVLSHSNLQANRFQLSACIDFTATDKVFNALPLFHSFGLTGGMLLPFLSGVKIFLYPSPLHYRIIPELAYDTNATIFFGTDTFLLGYAKYAHPYNFYSVRYVFAGAERLREETFNLWSRKFGVRIFEGYGATETSPVLAINTPMHHKVGTVGRLLPGVEYQIQGIPGIEQGGMLFVQGPNIMQGYLLMGQPGVIQPLEGGWYETGDIVTMDEEGFLTIIGRVKRFAKIGGEMVSLAMVEQQVHNLWPDDQHAVVNVADQKKGEQLVLVTTFSAASREAVVAFWRSNLLAEIAIPKKIVVIEKMPLLATGKVDYKVVQAYVESLLP